MDLYEACENGNEERVVELLVRGQDSSLSPSPLSQLRSRTIAGRTALHGACLGGQATVVRLLLGEKAIVHFTSRTKEEVETLLQPLANVFLHQVGAFPRLDALFQVQMVTKDGSSDLVPMAHVQLPPQWTIPPSDLLQGIHHVDDFGNTPLQCISCFGCGSTLKHLDDGLEMTKLLLRHGDQPNLPKRSNKWTPLHWGAYNGNVELIRILLDPVAHIDDGTRSFAKTQVANPLVIDTNNHFAVDIAGRRGLALADERTAFKGVQLKDGDDANYVSWRRRLDHVEVLKVFIKEFVAHGTQLTRYVSEMNARNPVDLDKNLIKVTTAQDALRYGQHLLYWAGCFGLVDEVRTLLELELLMSSTSSLKAKKSVVKPLLPHDIANKSVKISLQVLYTCSCEAGRRQSVLHAAAAHGQVEILHLFLTKLLKEQTSEDAANSKMKRLDVTEFVKHGWRNERNETPLFQAALYLQDAAVRLFVNAVCPKSLAWELENVNVEGSLLHHVTNEASRAVLGMEQSSARPEYALLFDGVRKKQFKEMVIETLHEESSIAPSLVVKRAGIRETSFRSCWEKEKTDYLVVGATNEVLIQQAQALQLKVKHRGASTRSKYNAKSPDMFEAFRSLQRQQVILSIIQKKIKLQKHLENGNIRALFPLHDAMGCRTIIRQWGYTDSYHRIFQPFAGNTLEQFLLERKRHEYEMLSPLLTYFGEKHAFYYAFMTFYTAWLFPIALLGMVCQMLWLVDNVRFVPPLYALVVPIWATLMVERWKRKKSEIQRKFGHFRRNRSEEMPGFYGDFHVETMRGRAQTRVDMSFPKALQLARIYTGIPFLLLMGVAVVVIFVAIKTNVATSALVRKSMPLVSPVLVPYMVPLINAISMLLLDNWYTRLARALTRWENHRTVWEFESMLAIKLFGFKFLNAFLSLFCIAFVDQDAPALRKQLLMIMGIRQLWTSIQRDLLPLWHVRARWKAAGLRFRSTSSTVRKSHTWSFRWHNWYDVELSDSFTFPIASHEGQNASSPPPLSIVLVQELMYPHDFLLDKQMEIVLQFGYVTMFVAVLPVAPLFALMSNVVAMRLDVLSCTQVKRRPPFESETEVSTFLNILEFMSFAAVAVNCAVLFFTTSLDFQNLLQVLYPNWSKAGVKELWVLLVSEHIVLGVKAILSFIINDTAAWVRLDEDQSDEEEKQQRRSGDTSMPLSDFHTTTTYDDGRLLQAELLHKSEDGQRRLNQALTKQYIAALEERDAALKREGKALELLTRLKKEQVQNDMAKQTENLSVSFDHHFEAQRKEESGSVTVGRRQCFICYALRNLQKAAEKRCLSCHIAVCTSCDEILHLDDVETHERAHFRVKFTIKTKVEETYALPAITKGNKLDLCLPRPSYKLEKKQWEALQRYVERFTGTHTSSHFSSVNPGLSTDQALQRCRANIHISLRYLRNHERQRLYVESNKLALSPALSSISNIHGL